MDKWIQESNAYSVHKGMVSQLVFSVHQDPEVEAGAGEGVDLPARWAQGDKSKAPFPHVLCRPPVEGTAQIRNDLLTSN